MNFRTGGSIHVCTTETAVASFKQELHPHCSLTVTSQTTLISCCSDFRTSSAATYRSVHQDVRTHANVHSMCAWVLLFCAWHSCLQASSQPLWTGHLTADQEVQGSSCKSSCFLRRLDSNMMKFAVI